MSDVERVYNNVPHIYFSKSTGLSSGQEGKKVKNRKASQQKAQGKGAQKKTKDSKKAPVNSQEDEEDVTGAREGYAERGVQVIPPPVEIRSVPVQATMYQDFSYEVVEVCYPIRFSYRNQL